MRIDTHVEALQSDLDQIAAVGDDATSRAAKRLSAAIRAAASLRILGAINEAALEVSAQIPGGHVDVRFADNEAVLVYSESEHRSGTSSDDDPSTARISLRLPQSLKEAIEDSAARESLSVNAWLVRALTKAVATRGRRGPGSRLTGYATS
jgi:hypothetical protein